MKLLNEEKNVSKILRTPLNILLFFFFVSHLSAQTFINNFCYYKKFDSSPGYQKIFITDFSQDNIPDLILLNGTEKTVLEFMGNTTDVFEDKNEKFFFFTISDLNKFINTEASGDVYLFLSRKERLGGLASFTKYGTIRLLNKIQFDSYPEKSIIGDINNDGKNEAVVFGSNFDGLTILYEQKYVLKPEIILERKSYSEAAFINLDYDDYIDLVCFNYLKGTFDFLYNEDAGLFYENRQIEFGSDIRNLSVSDFNRDGFDDLLFNTDKQIHFFLGDSVSSFENRRILDSKEFLADFVSDDFNRDGFNDIAFITESGSLFISFALNNESLGEPVFFMNRQNLVDIHSFRQGKKIFLVVLSGDGELYTISNSFNKNHFSIALVNEPSAVSYFDYSDSYNSDLVFIDKSDSKLKILLRGHAGGFEKYYETTIEEDFDNILVAENQKPLTTMFCYNSGKKLVEKIECDFSAGTFKKNKLYTNNRIADINIVEEDGRQNLFALLVDNKTLLTKTFSFEKNSVTIEKSDTLFKNIFSPAFSFGLPQQISYWTRIDSFVELNYINTFMIDDVKNALRYKAEVKPENIYHNRYVKLSKLKKSFSLGYTNIRGKSSVSLHDGMRIRLFKFDNKPDPLIKNRNHLYYYKCYSPVSELVFCYDADNKILFYTNLREEKSNNLLSPLYKNIYIKNYFVTDLFLNQVNLIYSDPEEKCITIRRIE